MEVAVGGERRREGRATWRGGGGGGEWWGGVRWRTEGWRGRACDVTGSGVDDRRVNAPVAWFQPSGKRVDAHLHR